MALPAVGTRKPPTWRRNSRDPCTDEGGMGSTADGRSGSRRRHAHSFRDADGVANRRPVIPFVMHWHGTDIRTNFYQSKSRPAIEWGAERAAHVLYATPDLREHAVKARPDATYLPIPIDFSELPRGSRSGPLKSCSRRGGTSQRAAIPNWHSSGS